MKLFAKLFCIEGVGQVLVTLDQNEDEKPAVIFRIADVGDYQFSMNLCRQGGGDFDAEQQFAETCFDAVCDENILATIKPLLEARAMMSVQGVH